MAQLGPEVAAPLPEPVDKDSTQLDVTTSATNTCTIRLVEFLCVDNSTKSDKENKTLEINKEYLNPNDLNW